MEKLPAGHQLQLAAKPKEKETKIYKGTGKICG